MHSESAASPGQTRPRIAFALAVIVTVCFLPTTLGRGDFEYYRFNFDKGLLERLKKERPEIVLIGNSMLFTRIERRILRKVCNRRVSLLAFGGSASAMWYLALKNFAADIDPPPKVVLIMFRNRVLSIPWLRTEGDKRKELLSLMPELDTDVLRLVEGDPNAGLAFRDLARVAYPILEHRGALAEHIRIAMKDLATGTSSKRPLHDRLEKTFRTGNLRRDLPSKMPPEANEKAPTVPIKDTFLPLMTETAREADIQLIFYRVRRCPDTPSVSKPERMAALEKSMAGLEVLLPVGISFYVFQSSS